MYYGIETRNSGEWKMVRVVEGTFQQAMDAAASTADHRVKRISKDAYMSFLIHSKPGFSCPRCNSTLSALADALHCEICKLTLTEASAR